MPKNYRFDDRTEEEFIKDIKECHDIEYTLMSKYVKWLNERKDSSKFYTFSNYGVDNTGEYIEKNKEVNTDADFILLCDGQENRPIEIKFCREERYVFHFKINQLESYYENNVCIVNWMGSDTDNPRFCIFTPSGIKDLLDNGKRNTMWKKPCIRVKCSDCQWFYINQEEKK